MKERARIRCPLCGWRPTEEDRWECLPRCGTVWNTFWTRGTCPGCSIRWPQTQCHACMRYSRHEAWYHEPGDEDANAPRQADEKVHDA